MNSPRISVVGQHNSVFFSFRLRAGELINLKHCTQTSAINSRAKHFFVEMHTSKIEVWENVDGTLTKILQGTMNVPSDSRLALQAVDTMDFAPPQYQTVKQLTSATGSICIAVETASAVTWTILQTNLILLRVINAFLDVNGVTTTIAIAQDTAYVISASFVGTQIEASALNITTNVLVQYASSGDESSFVSQHLWTANFTAASTEAKIGEWVLAYGNSDALEKKIAAKVLAMYWPGREDNLGTYAAGTFSGGATYDEDTQELTHGSVYSRVVPKLDQELQDIFRLGEEVYEKTESTKKGYENRVARDLIRCVGVGVNGMDQNSLIYSGQSTAGHIEISQPDYFSFHHRGRAVVFCSYVDSQDDMERQYDADIPCSYTISIK